MLYRLVLFDFDGTLADSFAWFLRAMDEAAQRFGFRRIQAAEVDSLRDLDTRALLDALGVPRRKLPAIAAHMRASAGREAARLSPFPGVREVLAGLHGTGLTLGLVTSNFEENARTVLGEATFGLFAHVDCGASLLGKASRLRRVVRAAGVAPGDAVYVGDEQRDLQAAREVGLDFAAVLWGYASPASLRALRPDHTFEAPAELARLKGGPALR